MGLIENLTAVAEQATAGARASVHEAELRHDLEIAYGALGRRVYALADVGPLAKNLLTAELRRVRAVEAKLAALAAADRALRK